MEAHCQVRVKLDENLSKYLKSAIARLGHDAHTVADEELLGMSDVEVGRVANQDGRMLLTLDIEFADLRKHPPGQHAGIILFRPHSMGPMVVNNLVLDFLAQHTDLAPWVGCTVVVEPGRIRIRNPD
ncbi:MAG: DUF5615 family PIN-like protein [Candidatus Hydrogenedentes bacterium]|nr:DUF5615 family PIN-like protein [Candidatus Hydrogenedentota bacterium]